MDGNNRQEKFIMELNKNEPWVFGFHFSDAEVCKIDKMHLNKLHEWKIFDPDKNIPIQNYDSNYLFKFSINYLYSV